MPRAPAPPKRTARTASASAGPYSRPSKSSSSKSTSSKSASSKSASSKSSSSRISKASTTTTTTTTRSPARPAPTLPPSSPPSPTSDAIDRTDPLWFVSAITLPTDRHGEVLVWDSCDELRRKIRAFFANPAFAGVTQKRFLHACGDVNSNSYQRFMRLKGSTAGIDNGLCRGAYCFFEKMRIAQGKKKSKKREERERARVWF